MKRYVKLLLGLALSCNAQSRETTILSPVRDTTFQDDDKAFLRDGLRELAERRVEGQASPSLIVNNAIWNTKNLATCSFASNAKYNVLYCADGKLIVQDSKDLKNLLYYVLPNAASVTQLGVAEFRFFENVNDADCFFVQIGYDIYTWKAAGSLGATDEISFTQTANYR